MCAGSPFENLFKTTDDRLGESETALTVSLQFATLQNSQKEGRAVGKKKERSKADTVQVDNGKK